MNLSIPANELTIYGIEDPKQWKWIRINPSSSVEVAQMLEVHKLDIMGKILDVNKLRKKTSYSACMMYKLQDGWYGMEKVNASVTVVKEISLGSENEGCTEFIDPKVAPNSGISPHKCIDGWSMINLGEFFIDSGDEGYLEMRMFETTNLNPKSGLLVKSIDVLPIIKTDGN